MKTQTRLILLVLILTSAILLTACLNPDFVPKDYTKTVRTGGKLEAKYLKMGKHKVSFFQEDAPDPAVEFRVYYPSDMKTSKKTYPAVIFVNGTGVYASKYSALFEHLASWGFIAVGNEDPSTGTGASAEQTLVWLLKQNKNRKSIFYGKIDTKDIGLTGHSQGGAGVLSAASIQEHAKTYKAIAALSPTHTEVAHELGWPYELSKITCPTLLTAGTESDFETKSVIPMDAMQRMYKALKAPKVRYRHRGSDHGMNLYAGDGYVTAWFLWQLQDNKTAAKVFTGSSPELMQNKLYQNRRIDL